MLYPQQLDTDTELQARGSTSKHASITLSYMTREKKTQSKQGRGWGNAGTL